MGRGGRPPLDSLIVARVLGLAAAHPGWSLRRLAAEAGCSKDSARRVLRRGGEAAGGGAAAPYAGDSVVPGVPVPGVGFEAAAEPAWRRAWAAREMTEADHAAFEAAGRRAPGWWWE